MERGLFFHLAAVWGRKLGGGGYVGGAPRKQGSRGAATSGAQGQSPLPRVRGAEPPSRNFLTIIKAFLQSRIMKEQFITFKHMFIII